MVKRITFLFLLIILAAGSVQAKSYSIPIINVNVSINEDGTVQVTEQLTYVFDGSFSWAEYKLPRQGYTSISNIRVAEDGDYYLNEDSEETGTFSVAKSSDAIRIKWHYRAENERRTFTISYTLHGALTIGPQWAQFFWNFVSDTRDKPTKQLDITIQLPREVPKDSLYGWTRGPEQRIRLQTTPGTYSVQATNIDDSEFVKVRAVFPSAVFNSQLQATDPDFSLAWARQNEQSYRRQQAKEQAREAYLADLFSRLNYLLAVLSIGIFYFLYRRYGRRHSTSRYANNPTIVIPGKLPPALAGWLLQDRNITGNMIMATILDLARRGYFVISEGAPEEDFLSKGDPTFNIERTEKKPSGELDAWESEILGFLEERLNEGEAKLHKIFEGRDNKTVRWFSKWKKKFKAHCFEQGWIDEESYTGAYWNFALQFLLLAASITALVYAGPIAFVSLIVTIVGCVCSFLIIRRTPKGEELYQKWNNYKEGLKHAEEYSISSNKLDRHFIYAVAFGLERPQIEKLVTSSSDGIPEFYWFVYASNTSSVASVANAFATLNATGSTTFASATGGSGASAGAAGGGASASAG